VPLDDSAVAKEDVPLLIVMATIKIKIKNIFIATPFE
jgi:hypothetical protein